MTTFGKFAIALLAATALATATADARSLKWARSGDSLTLDPHAQNEGPTHNLSHHIYEPLIHRDFQGKEVPALSVSWKVTDDANVWEVINRRGELIDRVRIPINKTLAGFAPGGFVFLLTRDGGVARIDKVRVR